MENRDSWLVMKTRSVKDSEGFESRVDLCQWRLQAVRRAQSDVARGDKGANADVQVRYQVILAGGTGIVSSCLFDSSSDRRIAAYKLPFNFSRGSLEQASR